MGIKSGLVRRYVVAVAVVAISVALAACGSDSDGGDGGSANAADAKLYTEVPASGCGSQPTIPADDPEGVVAELPKAQQAAYESLSIPTYKSSWSNFKPKHAPPYTVGLNLVPSGNDFMKQVNETLVSSLKASPNVGKVTTRYAQTFTDVVGQLSNFDALLREKPDLIVVAPIQPIPFSEAVDRAAKQGIPVVGLLNSVPTKNAVNIGINFYEGSANTTATMMRLIGGKGNTAFVSGAPGDVATDLGLKGYKDAIKRCPGVKDLGQIYGTYTNSIAKRETLTFLATHPQKIAGVGNAASMAPGIMQAFQQSGRPMPIVQDSTVQKGSLGYWRDHPDYSGIGYGAPPAPAARTAANVALRILEGQGPKLNNLVTRATIVTPANLDQWAEPGWTLSTNGVAPGPDKDLMSDDYLDPLFNSGAQPK